VPNLDLRLSPRDHHGPDSPIYILIVDDQPANLIALEAALSDCGYHLITATSGEEAIHHAGIYEFAAILLDVQMPHLNGFETATLIRSHEKSRATPIIFLTAIYQDELYVTKGYEAGAVDYLYKPLNIAMLKAKLNVFSQLFRQRRDIIFQSEVSHQFEQTNSDRKIAEIQRSTQQQYQDLVEGIRNGIVWSANADPFVFSFVSPQAETLLGHPLTRFLEGFGFLSTIIPSEDLVRLSRALEHAHRSGNDIEVEHRMMRADGLTLWFNSNVRITKSSHGLSFRGISTDVTKLKETEKSLREMIDVRDEFLWIASHELKTPLTPLQLQVEGFLRLFEQGRLRDVPEPILKQMLETSGAQVSILVKLVDQLLDVSRVTSGKFKLNIEDTDLVACVTNVAHLFQSDLITNGMNLKFEQPGPVFGRWDRTRIEQVVMNLVNNAIKYGKNHALEICIKKMPDSAVLTVKDFGIGIAKKDQGRIFGRFERAVSPSSFSGLGLGLFITREIVEQHHGKISVESEPACGALFTIELPLLGPLEVPI
jgi:PAS domain S-box-containing protein